MKRQWIVLMVMGLVVSCTNVRNRRNTRLQAQRDSLLMQSADSESEAAEMMAVISEVEENFERIREAESISLNLPKGEMSQDTRSASE